MFQKMRDQNLTQSRRSVSSYDMEMKNSSTGYEIM